MQNPNHARYSENMLEDEKHHNEGLISFIDNDYVLNFLNDPESAQRRYFMIRIYVKFQGQYPKLLLTIP